MEKIIKPTWFSQLRATIFPVSQNEAGKVLLLFSIFFLGAFIFHTIRDLKDTLIITAEYSGAEVIPFLKVWAILPVAIFVTFICNKLFNVFHYKTVGTILIFGFMVFFLFFVFVLYPHRESLHLYSLATYLETILPGGCKGIIMIIRYWSFSLFYVVAEMWGVMILSLFLWRFVNDTTSIFEAKRFFPIILLSENLSGILSGPICYGISNKISHLYVGKDLWEQSLIFLILLTVICGMIMIVLFHRLYAISPTTSFNKSAIPKEKMSLSSNIKAILNSKTLICIVIMVLCYQLATNLLDVLWKSQVRILHPSPGHYNAYINQVTMWTGIVSVVLSIAMSEIFRRFKWRAISMATPVILLLTSLLFLPLLIFHDSYGSYLTIPLALIVFIGSTQNILIKASKFSLFDATKEIAFVSLDVKDRRNGKAAIDGIGSRLGKSGGSLLYQGFLIIFGSLAASTPYIAIVLLTMIIPLFLSVTKTLAKTVSYNSKM